MYLYNQTHWAREKWRLNLANIWQMPSTEQASIRLMVFNWPISGIWAHYPSLVKFHATRCCKIMAPSRHNFAHITKVQLPWLVQISELIACVAFTFEQRNIPIMNSPTPCEIDSKLQLPTPSVYSFGNIPYDTERNVLLSTPIHQKRTLCYNLQGTILPINVT